MTFVTSTLSGTFGAFLGMVGWVTIIVIGIVARLQSLVGFQGKPRPLDATTEVPLLQEIFGNALDYSAIRVVEERLGLLDVGTWPLRIARRAPFTAGNTTFVPGGRIDIGTLVHEAVHIWQYQHGGSRYIPRALIAQRKGGVGEACCPGHVPTKGYDFDNALTQGKPWSEFNPEQQAAFIEYAECTGHGLFLTLSGSLPGPAGDVDWMAALIDAVNALRAGEGAPR